LAGSSTRPTVRTQPQGVRPPAAPQRVDDLERLGGVALLGARQVAFADLEELRVAHVTGNLGLSTGLLRHIAAEVNPTSTTTSASGVRTSHTK
jgi:hypothetical protein